MPTDPKQLKVQEALTILTDIGMPRAQLNERSALCLLALLDLTPNSAWQRAQNPLVGITPIMDWAREHYAKDYAPNSRETVRRQTMHQFMQAGIALYNPDKPSRAVNSPHAVYQIEPAFLNVVRCFGSSEYKNNLSRYASTRQTLAAQNARHREMVMIPLIVSQGQEIKLSPGIHSELIREIWVEFAPRFVPGGHLIYAGDTGDKWGFFDQDLLSSLGVNIDNHGKMPDVIIYYAEKNWLILAEAVTSHGPVDSKRHEELLQLFKYSKAGLVFVSAFPNKRTFTRYVDAISWETEVWIADNPTHLIHFNGTRFLGPHP